MVVYIGLICVAVYRPYCEQALTKGFRDANLFSLCAFKTSAEKFQLKAA